MLSWIRSYTTKHQSILREEPNALPGAAAILRHIKRVNSLKNTDLDGDDGDVGEWYILDERMKGLIRQLRQCYLTGNAVW